MLRHVGTRSTAATCRHVSLRRGRTACPRTGGSFSRSGSTPSTRVNSSSSSSTDSTDTAAAAGSVWGSALLVSGTTIGAGILALPVVTQQAGFVPSAVVLTAVCGFSIATGLLVAEVSIRLMRQQGGGSVSMITMSRTTLGPAAAAATSAAYIFLHYALLVAYMSKAGEIVGDATGLPLAPAAAGFAGIFGALCYLSSQQLLDKLNGALVGLVVAAFVGLLVAAAPGVDPSSLVQPGDWSAVPATLPVVALAFVYHNVVPVVVQALEGDAGKVRTAICAGVAIPWVMFVSWEGAILGSVGGAAAGQAQATYHQQQQQQGDSQVQQQQQQQQQQLQEAPELTGSAQGGSPSGVPADSSSSATVVTDPLAALSAGNQTVGPLIQGFSFLAIATSFIGFVLGLTDFAQDGLSLPSRQAPLPYLITLLPPYAVAVSNPNIFLGALDTAGTYGVLTLFGILPAAMAWSSRQSASAGAGAMEQQALLPGGTPMLVAVGAAAASVIVYSSL